MSRNVKLALGGLLVVVALIGGAAWWLGFFEDTPEEASVEAIAEAVQAQEDAEADAAAPDDGSTDDGDTDDGSTDDGNTDDGNTDDGSTDDAATTTTTEAPLDSIDGTWVVTPVGDDVTFVGYRINEVLNTIGDFTVVGRTSDVTGALEASGTTITAVDIVARMDTLTTDNGGRDRAMRSQALETDEFPEATFRLTTPIELGSIPDEGIPIKVVAIGELTIHGVTQSVEFPLDAQIQSGAIVAAGQLQVALADFDISAPSAPVVASVEDVAILELSLAFTR